MVQEPVSDEVLAAMAKGGDVAAFEKLFYRHRKPILNFIYRLIGSKETAEDVAQDVFIKGYKNLYLYDPKRKFSTWLYTIARNQAKNALRDRKYFRDTSLDMAIGGQDGKLTLKDLISDPGADPAMIAESEELERQAQKVIDSLPIEYKEVITLCSIQGLTYNEAAEIIGCSAPNISIRLKKAKELFIKRLGINS